MKVMLGEYPWQFVPKILPNMRLYNPHMVVHVPFDVKNSNISFIWKSQNPIKTRVIKRLEEVSMQMIRFSFLDVPCTDSFTLPKTDSSP